MLKRPLQEFFQRVNALIVVCRKQEEQLIELGAVPERIHFVPNGFLAERYRNTDDSKRDPQKISFLGRLHPVKRVDLLIRALTHCPPDITLDIAGDGPEERNLRQLTMSLNLQNRIRFLGALPRNEIPRFLCGTALLCIVSDREGWPTVINEALACGTPVLSTAVGGVPEALRDPKVGTLVPSNISPTHLAEKIVSSLAFDWDRLYIKEYAKQYTWENIAPQFLKYIKKLREFAVRASI